VPDFVLLDTDTSSEMIRGRDANIVQKAGDYLKAQGQFRISIITRYEILRSLKAKQE
jgi:tRNA(fMet)-specific endonuclease VapC